MRVVLLTRSYKSWNVLLYQEFSYFEVCYIKPYLYKWSSKLILHLRCRSPSCCTQQCADSYAWKGCVAARAFPRATSSRAMVLGIFLYLLFLFLYQLAFSPGTCTCGVLWACSGYLGSLTIPRACSYFTQSVLSRLLHVTEKDMTGKRCDRS